MLDVTSLQRPEVTFVVARDNGRALGCGAVVNSGESWAEIKRIVVAPAARGQGLGQRLLQKLESIAIDDGVTLPRLETAGAVALSRLGATAISTTPARNRSRSRQARLPAMITVAILGAAGVIAAITPSAGRYTRSQVESEEMAKGTAVL